MQMVSALHGCSDFGAISFTLMATTAPSPEPRHRRHRPAMKCLLQLLVAQSCIAWTACHANAAETPLRVRIAESDSVHNVGMQNLFAYMYSGAFDSANFAVLYGCQRVLLLSSLGGAGRLSGQKLSFFFSRRHLSIHHISLWSAESKAVKSIGKTVKSAGPIGEAMVAIGAATGQPEISALGATTIAASKLAGGKKKPPL